MRVLVVSTIVASAIFAGVLYASPPVDAGGHSAVRSFEAALVHPGEDITVEIEAKEYGLFGRVIETLPEGWTYKSSSLSETAVSIKGRVVSFLLLDEEAFTYTVTAPDSGGIHTFSGVIEDFERARETIGGDSEITVLMPTPVSTPTATPTVVPTPTPTPTVVPTPVPPDTGGTAPSAGVLVLLMVVGIAVIVVVVGRRGRFFEL